MPDIGGIEVVEFVRSQDKLRSLPIVVVTTRGDEGSRTRALAAGATRFMTKPFTPETILAEVRALLGGAAGARGMSDALDSREFLAGYLAEVEEHLSASATRLLAARRAGRARQGATPAAVRELFRSLHTIKGLSAMVGVEPIVDIAHEMETLLRERRSRRRAAREGRRSSALLEGVRAIEDAGPRARRSASRVPRRARARCSRRSCAAREGQRPRGAEAANAIAPRAEAVLSKLRPPSASSSLEARARRAAGRCGSTSCRTPERAARGAHHHHRARAALRASASS